MYKCISWLHMGHPIYQECRLLSPLLHLHPVLRRAAVAPAAALPRRSRDARDARGRGLPRSRHGGEPPRGGNGAHGLFKGELGGEFCEKITYPL